MMRKHASEKEGSGGGGLGCERKDINISIQHQGVANEYTW